MPFFLNKIIMWEQFLISILPGLISQFAGKDSTLSNMSSLFGQGYQTAQNYANQQENQQWQRHFAMQQFNYNQMLNDRSFFHSLPASQVELFKNAGLSPDLMYGQMSSMNFGHGQSLPMPTSSSPNFAGLENSNLLKDLTKKDSEISLNLSKKQINEIDYSLKQIQESFEQGTLDWRVQGEFLKNQYQKITNQLQQSNVETNVINNMKLAASLGLVKSIDKDGNVVYSTTPKFNEIAEFYLSDLRQKYNIQEADFQNLCQKWNKSFLEMSALNSEILINSVAYQEEIINLITTAVGAGIDLKKDSEGNWVVNYDGDTGDVASVVALGLIDSVLSAIGVKFTLGKNASKVLGRHKIESKTSTDNTTRVYNTELPYNGDRGK